MARITGKNATIFAQLARTDVVADTAMVNSGDNLTYSYNSFWDPNKPPTIKKNTVLVDREDYTVNFISGTITFFVANLVTDAITVNDITWSTLVELADLFNWALDAKIDLADVTGFQDQYHTKLSSFRGWTATAESYHTNSVWFPYFDAALPVYVKLYPDVDVVQYFVGAAFVDFGEKVPHGGAVTDAIALTGTGALERRTV